MSDDGRRRFTCADGTKYVETKPGLWDFDRTPEEAAASEARIARWRLRMRLKTARESAQRAWDYYLKLKEQYAVGPRAEDEDIN